MMSEIYFCMFCPKEDMFLSDSDKQLRHHFIESHFNAKNAKIDKWIDYVLRYESDLNTCLNSETKQLPPTPGSQSQCQKLLMGCPFCDSIIRCFKLNMSSTNTKRDQCICGKGREENKVVTKCIQCHHLYHFSCVEPKDYSGEDISLYKCFKCKPKAYKISELKSESTALQGIHIYQHLNYLPIICKAIKTIGNSGQNSNVCNDSYFNEKFLKTHLKCDHKLTPNDNELSKYYELSEIPCVQQIIDNSLDKLSSPNSVRPLAQNITNITDANRRSLETSGQSMDNNRQKKTANDRTSRNSNSTPKTTRNISYESSSSSSKSRNSLNQIFNIVHNSNEVKGKRPERMCTKRRINNVEEDSDDLDSPPVLSQQTQYVPTLLNKRYKESKAKSGSKHSSPNKRKAKKSKNQNNSLNTSTQSNTSFGSQNNSNSANKRPTIAPHGYIADENPNQLTRSRLSEKSRLSRPNISHSREQEKAHKLRLSQSNSSSASNDCNSDKSDDSSGFDWTETEKREMSRKSESKRIETKSNQISNTSLTNDSRRQSDESIGSNRTERLRSETSVDESNEANNGVVEDLRLNTSENNLNSKNDSVVSNRKPLSTQITESEDIDSEPEPIVNDRISNGIEVQNQSSVSESYQSNPIYSDWLTHTKPEKYPYFPQINDEVVYFPYGHRQYIDAVKEYQLYRQTNTNKFVSTHLREIMFAKVKEIKYEKHSNVHLANLRLLLVDRQTYIETNRVFTVRFHDIDNVIDFIILRQTYETSLNNNWKIGDQFRSIIEDKWWFGKIAGFNINDYNMSTQFQSFSIVWANQTQELLSIWDLEKIRGFLPENKRKSVDITDEERQKFYTPDVQEWPTNGRLNECQRIAKGLTQIMELKEAKDLMNVCNDSNPSYVSKIAYPINLQIIKSRVENQFYRRHAAIKYDIKFLESNASNIANQNSDVVTNARIVVSVCLKFIDELKAIDIKDIYKRVIEDKPALNKIKFYSCTRTYLNPNPNVMNPVIANSLHEIMMPSTSRPIINLIDSTNNTEVPVIDMTMDSDEEPEDKEEEEEDIYEPVVEERPNNSPVRTKTPPKASQITVQKSSPKTPPNLVNREITPTHVIHEPELTPNNCTNHNQIPSDTLIPVRYFCVFCDSTFTDRDETIDHYSAHLKIQLKCNNCSKNVKFDSFDQFIEHNHKHIEQMKPKNIVLNKNSFLNAKKWIARIVKYNDSLTSHQIIKDKIDKHFGDCCPVCKRLNVLREDSEPFVSSNQFIKNRKSLERSVKSEQLFEKHLRQHLSYVPNYYCTLCPEDHSLQKTKFSSPSIDNNCREHLDKEHRIKCEKLADVTPFYLNSKIQKLEEDLPNLVNNFIINCLNY